MQRRILVTDVARFMGSDLCERLLSAGHDVLCVDNFLTGMRHNISHLLNHKLLELLRHHITLPLYVEDDNIYNHACPASPIHISWTPFKPRRPT